MRYLLLGFIFLAPIARAEGLNLDPWTAGDTIRQSVVTSLLIIDWAQTRYISKHPCGRYEYCVNPYSEHGSATRRFIGEHPSTAQVNRYFIASIVFNVVIAYVLPRGWRDAWQYGSAGYELSIVLSNRSAGIQLQF